MPIYLATSSMKIQYFMTLNWKLNKFAYSYLRNNVLIDCLHINFKVALYQVLNYYFSLERKHTHKLLI